jgi:dGTPase
MHMSDKYIGSKKNGCYEADREYMQQVATACGLKERLDGAERIGWSRHPLSFLVEAADDICFKVVDPEDAVRLKFLSEADVAEAYQQVLNTPSPTEDEALNTSAGAPAEENDTSKQAPPSLAVLRGMVIDKAISAAASEFKAHYEAIMAGTFSSSLVSVSNVLSPLKKFTSIYTEYDVICVETVGFSVLKTLMDHFVTAALVKQGLPTNRDVFYSHVYDLLPCEYREQLRLIKESIAYHTILYISDYVMGMTDSYAVRLFKTLTGQTLLA